MTGHEYFEELISAESDGCLTDEEKAALDAHLRQCADCRRFREALRAVSGGPETVSPPAELAGAVMNKIKALPPEARPRKKKAKILALPRRRAQSVAVAAVAVLAVWAGLRFTSPRGMAPAEAPMAASYSQSAPAETLPEPEEGSGTGGLMMSAPAENSRMADEAPADEAPALYGINLMPCAGLYENGQLLGYTESEDSLDWMRSTLLTGEAAGKAGECRELELSITEDDGSVRSYRLLMDGEAILWQTEGGESLYRSPVSPAELSEHLQ